MSISVQRTAAGMEALFIACPHYFQWKWRPGQERLIIGLIYRQAHSGRQFPLTMDVARRLKETILQLGPSL